MVAGLLGIVLALQQAPQAVATVDRNDAAVGETVLLTIRVQSRGSEPLSIADPILSGLEVRGTREESRVAIGNDPSRITTRVLQLVATRAGQAMVGAVRVRQGGSVLDTPPITLQIIQQTATTSTQLSARARSVLERAPPPPGIEEVALDVIASPDSVLLGEQIDLVVAAWFPRETRTRLRVPPTLSTPDLQGAWVYHQVTPTGIGASRLVEGRWYDLFVAHDVVFPLTSGRLKIGRANVAYDLPVTVSFFTRELRHVVQSETLSVAVIDQPRADRPAGFSGAAARDLDLSATASPMDLSAGEASTVTVTVTGRGNVALWPEPDIRWPAGLRVYPADAAVSAQARDGLITGSKVFSYIVVPDSVGLVQLPSASFGYFDLATRRYVERRTAPVELVVRPGLAAGAPRSLPPALMSGLPPWSLSGLDRLPLWLWLLLAAAPPVAVLAVRWTSRWRGRGAVTSVADPHGLAPLEREFRRVLGQLIPHDELREGNGLADALRAAGVEPAVATHTARVRDRLLHALYGPERSADADELTAEVRSILAALAGSGNDRGWLYGGFGAAGIMLAVLSLSSPLAAQAPSPERLYLDGAFRPAADSFAARARAEPDNPVHWYNLGNARFRSGDEVRARVAWIRAARLDPFNPDIRQALTLVRPVDRASESLLWVAPLAPAGAWLAALALWLTGWLMIWRRVQWRRSAIVLGLAAVIAGLGEYSRWRQGRAVAVAVLADTPLRAAPFGTAPASRRLPAGAAMLVERAQGPWLLIGEGRERGWVLASEVERL